MKCEIFSCNIYSYTHKKSYEYELVIILAFEGRLSEFFKKWNEGKKNTILVSRIIHEAATTIILMDNQIRTILPAMRKKRPYEKCMKRK